MVETLSTPSLPQYGPKEYQKSSCGKNYHIKRVSICGIPGNNQIRNQKSHWP